MPTQLQPQNIRNLGVYGVIRQAEVDDNLIPDGAVVESINFHFDRKGAATVRPGMTPLGATVVAAFPFGALVNCFSASLFAIPNDGSAWYWNGLAWGNRVVAGTLSTTAKFRYAEFLDRGVLVDGSYNSIRVVSFIGNAGSIQFDSASGGGIPLNMNQFASDATVNTQTLRAGLVEVFKNRIYLAGDPTTPSRLFFSSVATSTGKITWTPSVDWVDMNPSDGENITALKRYSLELDVFKPNYIYRFRTSGTDPDPLIKVGTRSQESIVEGKRGLYFHHDSGFQRYSGGYPEEISRPISDIVSAIPYSQYDDIIGWKDDDHIYWSIGNITIPDIAVETPPGTTAWKNVVIRYTESSDVWAVYSYPSDIRRATSFINAYDNTRTIVVGLDNGVISTLNTGTTDNSEPIKYRLITRWYETEGIESRKIVNKLSAICEKAQAMNLMCQTDDNQEWQSIGQLTKFLNLFVKQAIKYHRIRFKTTGVSRNEAPILKGIDILEGINEGLIT